MDTSEKHIWDVSWSTDEIRNHGQSWSLAGDAGLLNKLQDMAQTMISHTHDIQQEVVSLVQETEATDSKLHNIVNDCLMLSNTQFVESRVYDEEILDHKTETKGHSPQKENDEKKEAEIIAKVSQALHLGMSVIDAAYTVMPHSDSEDISYVNEPVLQPKNKYKDRLLPYVIGSQLFLDNDLVGLRGNDVENVFGHLTNETSTAVREEIADSTDTKSEGERSKDSDIFNDENSEQSDNDDNVARTNSDIIAPSKMGFEKELFAKIKLAPDRSNSDYGDDVSDGSSSSDIISSPKVKERRRNQMPDVKSSMQVPEVTKRKESSSPDNMDEVDNADRFRSKTMFSSKGGLFDDDDDEDDLFMNSKDIAKSRDNSREQNLFRNIIEDNQKLAKTSKLKVSRPSLLENDLFTADKDDDDNLFTKDPVRQKPKKEDKAIHSIFEDDDYDKTSDFLSGNKQIPHAQLESPAKLDEDERWSSQTSLSNKSINFQEASKDSPSSGSNKSSALFTDEPEIDDLFSTPFENKPSSRSILFSNDSEDVEDIFAAKPSSKTDKLHDDIFSSSSISKPITKKSILFEDDDDLFAVTKSKSVGPDGLKTEKMSANSAKDHKLTKPSDGNRKTSISLFDDNDVNVDLFADIIPSHADRPSSSRLPSDKGFPEEDLLFDRAVADNPDVNIFEDNSLGPPKMKDGSKHANMDNMTQKHPLPPTPSRRKGANKLFDDEDNEDDLFSSNRSPSKKSDVAASPLPSPRKLSAHVKENVNTDQKLPLTGQQTKDSTSISQHMQEISSALESPRKKPVGGVVCFGGIIPPLLKHPNTSSPTAVLDDSTEPHDPSASNLPGAYIIPPVSTDKSSTETPVSFDNPAETNILHSTNKDRIKIQVKRRPPTRRGRQEALRKSAIDILRERTDKNEINDNTTDDYTVATVSAPTSPLSPEPVHAVAIPPSATESVGKLTVESTRVTNIASPSTEEEDIFIVGDPIISPYTSHGKTIHSSDSKYISSGKYSPIKTFEEKDLFGSSVDDEDIDDLFKPKTSSVPTIQKSSNTKSSPRPPRKSSKSSNDVLQPSADRDQDPLPSAADTVQSSGLSQKTEHSGQREPSSDIFAHTEKTVQSKFSTSEVSVKSKSKLEATKSSKSLFDDDDDDCDLFKTGASLKSNTKVFASGAMTTNKSSPLKSQSKFDSLFNDAEDEDLFEDPLTRSKAN